MLRIQAGSFSRLCAVVVVASALAQGISASQIDPIEPDENPVKESQEQNYDQERFYIDIGQLAVSVLGFTGTLAALLFGITQYRRNQQWKQAEFLAAEAKQFADDPLVSAVCSMIDWSARKIDLKGALGRETPGTSEVRITREDQCRALMPHKVTVDGPGETSYEIDHAMIRDAYDHFFDWLERFYVYIETRLINARQLKPYLEYWIIALTRPFGGTGSCKWRCILLTYIQYYRYNGVVNLFQLFGADIRHSGELYKTLETGMEDEEMSRALREALLSIKQA